MSRFGKFNDFCRDSTLPICNLFDPSDVEKSCTLVGLDVGDNQLRNLGVIILAALAVFASMFLLWKSEKKQAAVGRREMQILLVGYIVVSIAEIFSIGGFLTNRNIVVGFSAVHIGAITATFWVLLLNAIVGYQILDDGTLLSIGLVAGSGFVVFLGTGYISLDTALGWTDQFVTDGPELKNIALYVLYLIFPLVAAAIYFILEFYLVWFMLGEKRPIVLLGGAALLFAIGQIFDFVVSVHLCNATDGKIDGSLFQTLFTLLSVVCLWYFWSSITEDVWMDEPLDRMTENAYP